MRIIGLTGGIASGKSTVSERLAALGAAIVDTDAIAHQLAMPGQPLWQRYRDHFGPAILQADQTLDRAAIARRVFAHPEERRWLDAAAHPLILAECRRQLAYWQAQACPVAVLDVPLLFEAGWDTMADVVWVVAVQPELQLERLMRRNSLSRQAASARVAAQLSLEEKCARADLVLDNNGTLEELRCQVDRAWRCLIEKQEG